MPHLTDGLSFKPLHVSIFALVFHHTVVFLLQTQSCAGQSQVVGPSQPIVATVGDDVILPCHLEPAVDASDMTVEWARPNLNPRFIYVWRDGMELEGSKHPSYGERTSMSVNNLKHGDISLKLSKVKLSDEGKYRCFTPTLNKESNVDLVVGVASFIVISLVQSEAISSGLVLQCESAGWYPEPELSWLDGEGNLLSAEPTETDRGPDGLYTVSSRVTMDKRHNFTCRVQQKNTNQTRETHIRIPEDVFVAPSCSVVLIVGVLCVCFLLFAAAFFIFWKLRHNKRDNKKHHNNQTEGGTELLTKRPEAMKDWDDEKAKLDENLLEKEEEKNDTIHVMSVLMEKKKELEEKKKDLENSRDISTSQLKEVEAEMSNGTVKSKFTWKKNGKKLTLPEIKVELENTKTEYENSLQKTEERLQKTVDVINRTTKRKFKLDDQIWMIKEQQEEETNGQRDKIQLQSEREEEKKNTHV